MSIYHVAIDGPSGAGKSTAAKAVAKAKGIAYLDTGAMYRAVGLYMYENGLEITPDTAQKALPGCNVEIKYIEGRQLVLLNSRDVSAQIRQHHVSALASRVSAVPCVREYLVSLQRRIALSQSFVLDGRDIGTHVLPDAKYKFFLTASARERALRRCAELEAKGEPLPYEQVLADIEKRDYDDSHRAISPLVRARDAVLVDSTGMDADAVVQYILSFIKE
ncbi:MAG: (d)CMP kinase [Firmicutes bacterium]|nr:(d)CMP kinase [Bacillota bacterium]